MRPIDADKIGLTDFEIVMCNGNYKKALEILLQKIEDAPTLKTIPIEWVHSQLKNNPNDIESIYDNICINELINKWQKEQEAR